MTGYPYRRDGCLLCDLAEVLEAREYELSEYHDLASHTEYAMVWDDRRNLGKMHAPGTNREDLL